MKNIKESIINAAKKVHAVALTTETKDVCRIELYINGAVDMTKPYNERYGLPPFWVGELKGDELVVTKGMQPIDATDPDKLSGMIHLALATQAQNTIAASYGGWLNLPEAEDGINDASRSIVTAMQAAYSNPLMGKFNIQDTATRLAVAAGEKSPFFSVPDKVYNHSADFIIPPITEENKKTANELAGLLRLWATPSEDVNRLMEGDLNWYKTTPKGTSLIEDINARIEQLGGITLMWR